MIQNVLRCSISSAFLIHFFGAGRSYITLEHALKTLLPEFFSSKASRIPDDSETAPQAPDSAPNDDSDVTPRSCEKLESSASSSPQEANVANKGKIVKLVRVQGIEVDMDIPFLWVANNLINPECYLHICVYVGTRKREPKDGRWNVRNTIGRVHSRKNLVLVLILDDS